MKRWKSRREILANKLILILTIVLALMIIRLTFLYKAYHKQTKTLKSKTTIHAQQISQTKEVEDNEPKIPKLPKYKVKLSKPLQGYIYDLCLKNNVSYTLFLGLMYQESGFNPNAVHNNINGTKDEGICQLNGAYSKTLASRAGINNFNPYNVCHNVKTAIIHLGELQTYWLNRNISANDLYYYVLGSYNRGTGGMSEYIKENKTIKTSYAENVLKYKAELEMKGELK